MAAILIIGQYFTKAMYSLKWKANICRKWYMHIQLRQSWLLWRNIKIYGICKLQLFIGKKMWRT